MHCNVYPNLNIHMLESQNILGRQGPTRIIKSDSLFLQRVKPFERGLLSRHLKVHGVTLGKGQETVQRLPVQPVQPSQHPWAKVPEHSVHDRAAELPGKRPASLHP